jgi:hypothetical protein
MNEKVPEICPVCKTGTLVVVGPAVFPELRRRGLGELD